MFKKMEPQPEQPPYQVHTERITISGERYLIYYTFSTAEPTPAAEDTEGNNE